MMRAWSPLFVAAILVTAGCQEAPTDRSATFQGQEKAGEEGDGFEQENGALNEQGTAAEGEGEATCCETHCALECEVGADHPDFEALCCEKVCEACEAGEGEAIEGEHSEGEGEPAAKEEPAVEEPAKEEPPAEEPAVEEPKVEEPPAEEPAVEEPKVEEPPPAEEPKCELQCKSAELCPVGEDHPDYQALCCEEIC